MDSIQPPTKPPRGVKNAKETSGLLMTVIRTLSTSDSNEQRDQERTKLEKDFKKSNQQLEELVYTHHDDLTRVMNLFGRVSSLISQSRLQIHSAKDNLIACKKLLTCRREELKKLWLESLEYKYTLQILNEIEQITEVPSQLVNCLSQKDYVQATHLLTSAINTSDNKLKDVVGLQELRIELKSKKQELCTKLLEEMKEQIYVKSTQEVIILKRQGSTRDSVDQRTPLAINRKITPSKTPVRPRKLLDVPSSSIKDKIQKSDTIEYTDDPEYVMSNLIDCVVLLDKVQDFLEEIKQSTQRELAILAIRTTKEISSHDSPSILLEFFQVLTDQFRKVIDAHRFVLEYFKKKYNTNSVYDVMDVWLKIQLVMQQLLADYLDVQNIKKTEQLSAENSNLVNGEQYDINSFFSKKKPQRTIKSPLFKFDNAAQSNGISMSHFKAYEKEFGKEKVLLCKPSATYITQLFVPLSRFSEETERLVNGANSDQPSKLNVFLNDYIGKVFLGKRHEEIVANAVGEKDGYTTQSKDLPTILNSQDPSSPL
ncbi:exocyst complex component 4 [Planococcus citri]|uniref:exocyst complex component 4 n=1 Tax=Planococcus citri TaxID=170843 RepID=UPI0031F83038